MKAESVIKEFCMMKKLLTLLVVLALTGVTILSFAESATDTDEMLSGEDSANQMMEEMSSLLQNRSALVKRGVYIGGMDFPAGAYEIMVPEDADYDSLTIVAYSAAWFQKDHSDMMSAGADLVPYGKAKKGEPYHIYLQKGDKLELDDDAVLVLVDPLFGVQYSDTGDVLANGWKKASTEVLQAALLEVNNEIQSRLHLGTESVVPTTSDDSAAIEDSLSD